VCVKRDRKSACKSDHENISCRGIVPRVGSYGVSLLGAQCHEKHECSLFLSFARVDLTILVHQCGDSVSYLSVRYTNGTVESFEKPRCPLY